VCKKLIKNSQPFGKKFQKTVGGIFFDSHCIVHNFIGEWEEFRVQRSENGCDVRKFRSFNHSKCKAVLNLLKVIYLRLGKIVVDRVTAVKFGVDNRGSDQRFSVTKSWTMMASTVGLLLERFCLHKTSLVVKTRVSRPRPRPRPQKQSRKNAHTYRAQNNSLQKT